MAYRHRQIALVAGEVLQRHPPSAVAAPAFQVLVICAVEAFCSSLGLQSRETVGVDFTAERVLLALRVAVLWVWLLAQSA